MSVFKMVFFSLHKAGPNLTVLWLHVSFACIMSVTSYRSRRVPLKYEQSLMIRSKISSLSTLWKLPHFFVTKVAKALWRVTKINSASFRSPWSACVTHHHHMPSFLLENEASLLPLLWSPTLAAVGTAAWRYYQWGGNKPADPWRDWPGCSPTIPCISLT